MIMRIVNSERFVKYSSGQGRSQNKYMYKSVLLCIHMQMWCYTQLVMDCLRGYGNYLTI